jgi:hypothetical protein
LTDTRDPLSVKGMLKAREKGNPWVSVVFYFMAGRLSMSARLFKPLTDFSFPP